MRDKESINAFLWRFERASRELELNDEQKILHLQSSLPERWCRDNVLFQPQRFSDALARVRKVVTLERWLDDQEIHYGDPKVDSREVERIDRDKFKAESSVNLCFSCASPKHCSRNCIKN